MRIGNKRRPLNQDTGLIRTCLLNMYEKSVRLIGIYNMQLFVCVCSEIIEVVFHVLLNLLVSGQGKLKSGIWIFPLCKDLARCNKTLSQILIEKGFPFV